MHGLIVIRQVVFEEDDLLLFPGADVLDRLQGGGQVVLDKNPVFGLPFVQEARLNRDGLPLADEDGVIADCRGLAAEGAV